MTKILLYVALSGVTMLTASKVSAAPTMTMPLKLTSISGTTYTTDNFNGTKTPTPFVKTSFNLKSVLSLISEIVYHDTGKTVPSDVDLMYDPITDTTYLTNKFGYYLNLYGNGLNIAEFFFEDVAASYTGAFYNGSEKDMVNFGLDVWGRAKDGKYYEIDMYSTFGTLSATYSGNIAALLTKTSAVKMSITVKEGTGYAEYQNSDDGIVGDGQMTLSGIGTTPYNAFPFSAYWYNYID